ncbi:MAG: YdcF family protein [Atopobiaceae bacterium]
MDASIAIRCAACAALLASGALGVRREPADFVHWLPLMSAVLVVGAAPIEGATLPSWATAASEAAWAVGAPGICLGLVALVADVVLALVRRRWRPQHCLDVAILVVTAVSWTCARRLGWMPPLAPWGAAATSAAPLARPAVALVWALLGLQALAGVSIWLFLGFTWGYAWLAQRRARSARYGAIVVLGAAVRNGRPVPLLQRRIERAAQLWGSTGAGALVVPTGRGSQDGQTEADAIQDGLIRGGVPANSIACERRATSTQENLLFSQEILRQRGVGGRVAVVTNDFHALRTKLLARSLGMDVDVVPCPTPNPLYATVREYYANLMRHPWTLPLAGALLGLVLMCG